MAAPRFFWRRSCGWTLVELVVVLVVGALLAYVAVRTFQPKEALALEQAERLRNDLRHVQMVALTRGGSFQLKMSGAVPAACPAGGSAYYWVIACTVAAPDPCTGAPNTPIADPRLPGGIFCVALESGLALGGSDLYFDPLGRPKTGAALIAANATFTISGGGVARTVDVAPLTGFVTAQ